MRTSSEVYHVAGPELYRRLDLCSASFHKVIRGYDDPPAFDAADQWALGSQTQTYTMSSSNSKLELLKYVRHLNIVDLPPATAVQHLLNLGDEGRLFPNLDVITFRPQMYIDYADLHANVPDPVDEHPLLTLLGRETPRHACMAFPTEAGVDRYVGPKHIAGCTHDHKRCNLDCHRKRYQRYLVLGLASAWLARLCHSWRPSLASLTLHDWHMSAAPTFPTAQLRIFMPEVETMRITWILSLGSLLLLDAYPATELPQQLELANLGVNLEDCGCTHTLLQTMDNSRTALQTYFATRTAIALTTPSAWDVTACVCCGGVPAPTEEPRDRDSRVYVDDHHPAWRSACLAKQSLDLVPFDLLKLAEDPQWRMKCSKVELSDGYDRPPSSS